MVDHPASTARRHQSAGREKSLVVLGSGYIGHLRGRSSPRLGPRQRRREDPEPISRGLVSRDRPVEIRFPIEALMADTITLIWALRQAR